MKQHQWFRSLSTLLILILSLFICWGAMADVMELPDSLTVIEVESFYGDNSLNEIVLPEGVRSIGSRAFANSSLQLDCSRKCNQLHYLLWY